MLKKSLFRLDHCPPVHRTNIRRVSYYSTLKGDEYKTTSIRNLYKGFKKSLVMSDLEFRAGSYNLRISSFSPKMDFLFEKLYKTYLTGPTFDFNDFKDLSFDFFEAHKGEYMLQGSFFDNFTALWMIFIDQQRFNDAENLWNDVLKLAYNWEEKRSDARIHKGTPYYFLGITSILKKDLDRCFLMMHQALEEDKKSFKDSYTQYPAYFFVTLDYQKDQFSKPQVLEIAEFIEGRLKSYRGSGIGSLSMNDFKSKFLMETALLDPIFYFVFSMSRIRQLIEETDVRLTKSAFSSILQANIIFDLCLIVDAAIKYKNPDEKARFRGHIIHLAKETSLSLNADRLKQINEDFRDDFSTVLQRLLDSSYRFRDGTYPTLIENDLAVAYGFRNFGAHEIKDQSIIYNHFKEISQRILNVLFFSIEMLY